eukprot:TRINITY_DN2656_c0_g2_i2.p1 TRINITY_DN2656_c0_g2~~TRINITY_DN2656_c0_g2_i2.p1  ORF type:complete len:598 (+),score=87.74 TRINITY_DN2656_c0_g2_i2:29-1795(+)
MEGSSRDDSEIPARIRSSSVGKPGSRHRLRDPNGSPSRSRADSARSHVGDEDSPRVLKKRSNSDNEDNDLPPGLAAFDTPTSDADSSTPSTPRSSKKKRKFVKYLMGEVIGKGAAAEVHKAVNEETGQTVAIKKMRKVGMKAEQAAAVAQEIELTKELKHPNVVDVIGSMEDKNCIYLILEYVDGGSLQTLMKEFGPFPPDLAAVHVTQVLRGLVFLHSHGVIHRDIKAANLLISHDGIVKLADFGVSAKLKTETEKRYTVVGTPYWMAPEVITMSGQTFKSDIWSLGCTVLELLSGHPPYWDVDPMRAMFCIVQDGSPPIPENLPQEVKDFLLRCFVKDPAKRASAEELLEMPWITQNAHLVSLAGAKIDYNSVVGTLSKVYGKKKSIKSSKSKKVSKKTKARDLQGSSPSGSDMSPATSSFDLSTPDTPSDSFSPSSSAVSIPPPAEPALVPIHSLSITHSDPNYVPPSTQHQPEPEALAPAPEPSPDPEPEPPRPVEEPQPPAPEPAESLSKDASDTLVESPSEPADQRPTELTDSAPPPPLESPAPEPIVSSSSGQSSVVAIVGVAIVGFVLAAAFVLSRRMRS